MQRRLPAGRTRRADRYLVIGALLGAVLLGGGLLAGCARIPGVYTYEKAGATAPGAGAFDPVVYVDGIWASKVVPTVTEKAVDADVLLPALAANASAASTKYGRQNGTGSPYAFLIKGTGTVDKVDTSDPTGPMTVTVTAAGKPMKVEIVTGPVIIGTAIRDAVGFIDFSQFTNQIDYANVSTQLNKKAKTDVIGKVDLKTLAGKKIDFSGAFSALIPGTVNVVPTTLKVVS